MTVRVPEIPTRPTAGDVVAVARPAILLDKDGTLLENVPYNVTPARMRLAPGAAWALRRMSAAGYELVVVSNQDGVARGFFTESALAKVEDRLMDLFKESGAALRGFLYCPHDPDGVVRAYRIACSCRKPAPGLLLRAAKLHHLDLARSWMIGGTLDDVEAGQRAGCRTILVNNGGETGWIRGRNRQPEFTTKNLDDAVRVILTEHRPLVRMPRAVGGDPW